MRAIGKTYTVIRTIILAVFILFIAFGSAFMYSAVIHEWIHVKEYHDPQYDVICWDLSEDIVAFATSREWFDENYVSVAHFQIYFLQGAMFVCILILIITVCVYLIWGQKTKHKHKAEKPIYVG